jgi:hypothetical protein
VKILIATNRNKRNESVTVTLYHGAKIFRKIKMATKKRESMLGKKKKKTNIVQKERKTGRERRKRITPVKHTNTVYDK